MIDLLLPYYERELALLREESVRFIESHPKIAARLHLSLEGSADPQAERLLQTFALCFAHVAQRIDDQFSSISDGVLDTCAPHLLRSFPSAAIAQLLLGGQRTAQAPHNRTAVRVPRGTPLVSAAAPGGASCQFRTGGEVVVAPLEITDAAFGSAVLPEGLRPPGRPDTMLSVRVEPLSPTASLAGHGLERLRVHLTGGGARAAALREALTQRSVAVYLQCDAQPGWTMLRQRAVDGASGERPGLPRQAGLEPEETLLPIAPHARAEFVRLAEFFAYPGRFDFVDLPWPGDAELGAARGVRLIVLFDGAARDAALAALLESTGPEAFALNCVPIVNLFEGTASAVREAARARHCTLVAGGALSWAQPIHSVNSVTCKSEREHDPVQTMPAYLALEFPGLRDGARYWQATRATPLLPGPAPWRLSLVDVNGVADPAIEPGRLQAHVSLTNGDLPTRLAPGGRDGELLCIDDQVSLAGACLITRPTPERCLGRNCVVSWQMLSHLKPEPLLTCSDPEARALRSVLSLYDLGDSATRRLIDGVAGMQTRRDQRWLKLPGMPQACIVAGLVVRLTLDETAFAGQAIALFAVVLEGYLARGVIETSFLQLTVVSARDGTPLLTREPRAGAMPML